MAHLQHFADGEGTAAVVHSHDVATEKVSLLWLINELIHDYAKKQGIAHQALVSFTQTSEKASEHVQGSLSVQGLQHILAALGYSHGLADGGEPWATTVSMVMLPCRGNADRAGPWTRLPRNRALPPAAARRWPGRRSWRRRQRRNPCPLSDSEPERRRGLQAIRTGESRMG